MRQLALIISTALLLFLLALGAFEILHTQRPPMPQQWSQLRQGMTPEQVHSLVGGDIYDLKAVQGVDVVTQMNQHGHWQLVVRYDSTGRVSKATACYIHAAGMGLLNSGAKKIL